MGNMITHEELAEALEGHGFSKMAEEVRRLGESIERKLKKLEDANATG